MLKKVIQVYPNPDFTVYVYFSDGKIKLYDMKPLVGKGVFAQIAIVDEFIEKCTVMNGTLAWDISGKFDSSACLDIDPETVYSTGVDVAVDPLEQQGA